MHVRCVWTAEGLLGLRLNSEPKTHLSNEYLNSTFKAQKSVTLNSKLFLEIKNSFLFLFFFSGASTLNFVSRV